MTYNQYQVQRVIREELPYHATLVELVVKDGVEYIRKTARSSQKSVGNTLIANEWKALEALTLSERTAGKILEEKCYGIQELVERGETSEQGLLYLVTQKAEGIRLTDALEEMRTYDAINPSHLLITPAYLALVFDVYRNLLLSIQKTHNAGVLHNDITPNNLIIQPETRKIIIIDYGNASICGDGINHFVSFQKPMDDSFSASYKTDLNHRPFNKDWTHPLLMGELGRNKATEIIQKNADVYMATNVLHWMMTGRRFNQRSDGEKKLIITEQMFGQNNDLKKKYAALEEIMNRAEMLDQKESHLQVFLELLEKNKEAFFGTYLPNPKREPPQPTFSEAVLYEQTIVGMGERVGELQRTYLAEEKRHEDEAKEFRKTAIELEARVRTAISDKVAADLRAGKAVQELSEFKAEQKRRDDEASSKFDEIKKKFVSLQDKSGKQTREIEKFERYKRTAKKFGPLAALGIVIFGTVLGYHYGSKKSDETSKSTSYERTAHTTGGSTPPKAEQPSSTSIVVVEDSLPSICSTIKTINREDCINELEKRVKALEKEKKKSAKFKDTLHFADTDVITGYQQQISQKDTEITRLDENLKQEKEITNKHIMRSEATRSILLKTITELFEDKDFENACDTAVFYKQQYGSFPSNEDSMKRVLTRLRKVPQCKNL